MNLGIGLGLTHVRRRASAPPPAAPAVDAVTVEQVAWTHDGERTDAYVVSVDGVEVSADAASPYAFVPSLSGGELVAVAAVGPGGSASDSAYVPLPAPSDPLLTAEEMDSDTVHTETTHGGYAGEIEADGGGGFAAADTWLAVDPDPHEYDHAAAPATEYDFRARAKTFDANYGLDRWSGYATAGATTPAYPVAAFGADDTTPAVGQAVAFASTSTGSGLTYLWDFGDSTSSTQANPSKTYSAAGTYTVTLTVTDAYGQQDAETKTSYIVATLPGPDSISGLVRWYTAGTWTTAGGAVSSWTDRTGTSNATQTEATWRPLASTDGGYAAAQFDGSDDCLAAGPTLSGSFSVFWVGRRTSTTQASPVFAGDARALGNTAFIGFTSGANTMRLVDNSNVVATSSATASTTSRLAWGVRRTGSTVRFYAGGSALGTDQSAGGNLSTSLIGQNTAAARYAGYIHEIVIYNRALTDGEVATLHAYFAATWGV